MATTTTQPPTIHFVISTALEPIFHVLYYVVGQFQILRSRPRRSGSLRNLVRASDRASGRKLWSMPMGVSDW